MNIFKFMWHYFGQSSVVKYQRPCANILAPCGNTLEVYTCGNVYWKCIGGVFQRPCGNILEELWQHIEWSFCKILPISCIKGFLYCWMPCWENDCCQHCFVVALAPVSRSLILIPTWVAFNIPAESKQQLKQQGSYI